MRARTQQMGWLCREVSGAKSKHFMALGMVKRNDSVR